MKRTSLIHRNNVHRPATGAYPHINREVLAKKIGHTTSWQVSLILAGKRVPRMDLAERMAGVIGVPLEELAAELAMRRKAFKETEAVE